MNAAAQLEAAIVVLEEEKSTLATRVAELEAQLAGKSESTGEHQQ